MDDIGIRPQKRHAQSVAGDDDAPKIFRFQAGQILIREGDDPNRVLFIAKGTCLIFCTDGRRKLPSCVGSMGSPTFIVFSALFDVAGLLMETFPKILASNQYQL